MKNNTFKLVNNVPRLYRWKTTSDVYKLGCTSWEDIKAPVDFTAHLSSQYNYEITTQRPVSVNLCGRGFESVENLLNIFGNIPLAYNQNFFTGINDPYLPEDNMEVPEESVWDFGEAINFNYIKLDWCSVSSLFDLFASEDGENWTVLGQGYTHPKRFESVEKQMIGEAVQTISLELPVKARFVKLVSYKRYGEYFAPYTHLMLRDIQFGSKIQTRELPEGSDLWWYEDSVSELHYDAELKSRYLVASEMGAEIFRPSTESEWSSEHYILIPGAITIENIDVSDIAWIEGCTFENEEAAFAALEMGQEAYAEWLAENDTEVAILEHQLDLETRMICQELGVEL